MIMFADQIHMAAVVTSLSRPQIAILNFDEESAYNFGGKGVIMDYSPTKR